MNNDFCFERNFRAADWRLGAGIFALMIALFYSMAQHGVPVSKGQTDWASDANLEMSMPKAINKVAVLPKTAIAKAPVLSLPTTPLPSPLPLVAPRLLQATTPIYPAAARAEGIEGQVWLSLQIGTDGKVAEAAVKSSSGDAALDVAAKNAAVNWIFVPAQMGVQNVISVFEVPVIFQLEK